MTVPLSLKKNPTDVTQTETDAESQTIRFEDGYISARVVLCPVWNMLCIFFIQRTISSEQQLFTACIA